MSDWVAIVAAMQTTPTDILKKYWGYDSFRLNQEKIITSVVQKNDTIAILPTGGGKSICFQVPALLFLGITIVISPLISLMQDQVKNLHAKKVSATFLNSTLTSATKRKRQRAIAKGKYKLVYLAPESLQVKSIQKLLVSLPISLIVIDEAHCISIWGKDFRPSYLAISQFVKQLSARPAMLAVTATATKKILKDISQTLQLSSPRIFSTPVARPNLSIQILDTPTTVIKLLFLIEIIQKFAGFDGIVYASTRKNTEYIAKVINHLLPNIPCSFYHGGLSKDQREKIQSQFIDGTISIIAATNAFGMGVDKPNIRFVIHYDTPISVENYSQEIGRAGRDQKAATCYTFFSETDRKNQIDFQTKNKQPLMQKEITTNATIMKKILLSKNCKARVLAKYFENNIPNCWNCSSCLSKKTLCASLTRAVDPNIFYALQKIRSQTHQPIPKVSKKILATLQPKTSNQITAIPGLGTAFSEYYEEITHLFPEENDKIHS